MSEHHHHDHQCGPGCSHEPKAPVPVPLSAEDTGARALSDALKSSFLIVKVIMVGLIVVIFFSGFFTVGSQERAVVLRFGKPVGEGEKALRGPGAHWSWPPPIDQVIKVPFSEVQSAKSTVGWYAVTPEQEATRTEPEPQPTLNPAADSYLLTGDANIVHVRATLRYRITDPLQFIFGFTNAQAAVTNALNNALYFAASRFSVDDLLTRNQVAYRERVERRIEQVAAQQQLGITVEQVTLDSVKAPRQVAERFRAALEASVRSERLMSEAQSYANEVTSRAEGDAAVRRGLAQSERSRLVEAVSAEAKRFSDVLPEYRKNPRLFTGLLQAEVMQRVFTNTTERFYVPYRADGRPRALRLDLGREPLKQKPAPEAPKEDHH